MKKRLISLILTMTMVLSLMLPGLSFAGTTVDAVSVMSPVYTALAAETGGTSALDTALAATDTGNFANASSYINSQTGAPQPNPVGVDLSARLDFVKAIAKIKYASTQNELLVAIANFDAISISNGSVMKTYFDGYYSSDVIDLFVNTYSNVDAFVTNTEATMLMTASDGSGQNAAVDALLGNAFDYQMINSTLAPIFTNYGWDTAWFIALNDEIRVASSDANSDAEFELINGLTRNQMTISSGSTTIAQGATVNYVFNIFGQNSNLFKLTTNNTSRLSIDPTDYSVTALTSGTATVYVHRAGTTPVAGQDYLYSFTVTVPSTSTGTTTPTTTTPTTTTPTAPETTEEAADDAADALTDSENVETEEEAEAVIASVGTTATGLETLASGATTEEEQEAVAETAATLATSLENTAASVTSPEVAEQLVTAANTVIQAVTKTVSTSSTTNQLVQASTSTQSLLTTAATAVEKMTDQTQIATTVTNLIQSSATVVKATQTTAPTTVADQNTLKIQTANVANKMVTLAESAISAAGKTTLAPNAGVDYATLTDSIQKALTLKTSLQNAFVAAGVDTGKTIKTSINLQLDPTSTSPLVINDPQTIFNQIDNLEVESNTVKVKIPKESVVEGSQFTVDLKTNPRADRIGFSLSFSSNTSDYVATLKKPVVITIKDSSILPSGQSLYRANADGTFTVVPAKFENGKVTVSRGGLSEYFVAENTKTFSDLSSVEWARTAIENLARNGITSGTSETTFSPNATITRAEFITMLMAIAQFNGDVEALPFTDVVEADWFAPSVAAAYANGVTSGITATSFAPYMPIKRQDIAVMISAVMKSQGYTEGQIAEAMAFGDSSEMSLYAVKSISLVSREGIINGTDLGEFNPQDYATRAEVAAMLNNLLNK